MATLAATTTTTVGTHTHTHNNNDSDGNNADGNATHHTRTHTHTHTRTRPPPTTTTKRLPAGGNSHGWCFGEDQGRYLVATDQPDQLKDAAASAGVAATLIGTSGGKALKLTGGDSISIVELKTLHEGWMPDLMAKSPQR